MCGRCTFSFSLSVPGSRGRVDVARTLEVDVFLNGNEVGCELPHVLSVIDDADHGVPAGEEIPVRRVTRKMSASKLLKSSIFYSFLQTV